MNSFTDSVAAMKCAGLESYFKASLALIDAAEAFMGIAASTGKALLDDAKVQATSWHAATGQPSLPAEPRLPGYEFAREKAPEIVATTIQIMFGALRALGETNQSQAGVPHVSPPALADGEADPLKNAVSLGRHKRKAG